MKVLIVAGGTGGHFYPGLAVAKELLAHQDTVHFVVRIDDKVIPWLEREQLSFSTIHAGGFVRKLSPKLLTSFINNIRGFSEVFEILKTHKPNIVMAMGGYLSFPVGFAAWIKKIPVVLHEQNAVPGLANRWLSRFSKKVAVTFPGSEKYFPEKAVLTGNPVRPEFLKVTERESSLQHWNLSLSKKTFLIFGGSLGARRLNELVVSLLDSSELKNDWQFLHFTGEKDEERIRESYQRLGATHFVSAYCHEMEKAYACADLVICRSGASTVSEILVTKKPALFVPYPYATNQHQTANAKVLVEVGVAALKEEKDLNAASFKEIVWQITDPFTLGLMRDNFRKLSMDFSTSAAKIRELLIH